MKNKKIIFICCGGALIVVCALIIVFVMGNQKNGDIRKNAESTLECMISSDFTENFYYIDATGNVSESLSPLSNLSRLTMSKMKYNLGQIEVIEDGAKIEAEFECVDMKNVIESVSDSNDSSEQAIDLIESGKYDVKRFNINLMMMNKDGIWYLCETPELDDVLTGGLYSLYMEMENTLMDGYMEARD